MNRLALVLALGAMLAIGACAPKRAAEQPDANSSAAQAALIAEGRRLAEINCSTCHAIGTEGESRNPAAPQFRKLSERYPVTMLEEAFAEGILVGHPEMPEFSFEPAQIDALLAYLQSIQESRGG
jgi:cytochrome c